jgi:predicted ATPase/DNA-binding SARP family transcriptional activator
MPGTRITLFGALEVAHGQVAPQRPPTQKVLSLLGYLIAHCDVPQGRDKLVDLLWPDLLPRQGRRMLSDTLWRPRRLLTPPDAAETALLDISGSVVAFRPSPDTFVDLLAFERLLQPIASNLDEPAAAHQSDEVIGQIREATALYRGDILEECYDDWTLYERERLRELYLGALRRLLAHDMATQAYDAGLQTALRLVRADPLREEAHRDLMRLYYLLGREADALRAYEHCRKILDEELGVEPDPATISLYEEIHSLQQRRAWEQARMLGGAPAGTPASQPEPPLVGRQEQRAELMDAVEMAIAGAGGMLLVAGEAGLGKSRMLREVAGGAEWRGAQVSWGRGREDAQALPFGALRDALASAISPTRARQLAETVPPYSLGTLTLLLPDLAEALPVDALQLVQSPERQVASLHVAIAEALQALGQIMPQVILLEDMHWFDSATLQTLTAILPTLRDARVLLIVSGRANELPQRPEVWNTLLQLDRSGLLRRVDLRGLDEAECADLIRRILRMRQPAPRFSARMYRATGGNPFFIVQTLRTLQEQGLLKRDEQGIWHTPLDAPDADYSDLPLPTGLHDAIDARLRGLAPQERAALAAAAVLGQNFTTATWAGMTTDDRRPTTEGALDKELRKEPDKEPIERLVSRSPDLPIALSSEWSVVVHQLLQRQFVVEDSAGFRFGHETLREVVYNDLDASTRQTLHLRAAETLEREHFARVEALAQHLYLAGAWDKSLPYLIQAGDRARAVYAAQDALRCYDQALEAVARAGSDAADVQMRWDIQLKRGGVATLLGDYSIASGSYEAVLRLAQQDEHASDAPTRMGARRGAQIQALNGLAYIYGQRNDYIQARAMIQQSMALAKASPRLIDRAEVFYQAGVISFRMDDYAEARKLLGEAIDLYDALGLEGERARCLSTIGWTYLRQDGPTDQVIKHFTQALEVYRRQGDQFSEHLCLSDIAGARMSRGQLAEALQAIDQCLLFFTSINALDEVSACIYTRGETYRRIGRLDQALESLQESLAICERLNRTAAAQFNHVFVAATLRDMGRYHEAGADIEQALKTDDRLIKVRALLVASDIQRIKGRIDCAWRDLEASFTLIHWVGSKTQAGIAYRLLAQLRIADTHGRLPAPSPDMPDVETSFAESARLFQEAHCDDELALTYLARGHFLSAAERTSEARMVLLQARDLMQHCSMINGLSAVQEALASLHNDSTALQPGQRRILLARKGVPRGRPLRPDELVEVIWTVDLPGQREIGQAASKTAARQEQLRRLCKEAAAQDAEPTVGDLAGALGVTARTVDRDIAALRAAGEVLVTRGSAG